MVIGTRIAVVTATFAFASVANANLIVNGGFENPLVGDGLRGGATGWDYWNASDVTGWEDSDSNIEIWESGFQGIDATEGKQFAELNAHYAGGALFSISQTFGTQAGEKYVLSFDYRARLGDEESRASVESNESFKVTAGDLSSLVDDHTTDMWSVFSDVFTAQGSSTTLTFTQVGYHNNKLTYGNFLDDISVSSVPEAGSIALFGLGLAGLGLLRVKKSA